MPGSYLIDVDAGVVFTRVWGVVNDDELLLHSKALRADPRFHVGQRQIVDFREVTTIRVTADGVRELARLTPFPSDARRAFVVTSDEAYGLLRMYGAFLDASNDQMGIFRTLEPALEWIGMERATPWPSRKPDNILESS